MNLLTLRKHYERLSTTRLSTLSSERCGAQISACDWTLNFSRQYLDGDAEAALSTLAEEKDLKGAIYSLFAGDVVNPSENRPALHWAFRSVGTSSSTAISEVSESLEPALEYADTIRKTIERAGIKTILHAGIGGSDFGPRLLYDAFKDSIAQSVEIRFVANFDPLDLERALKDIDPATTMAIGVSKSFSSGETIYNLNRIREWLRDGLGDAWPDHMAIVTASPAKAIVWLGRPIKQIFEMPLSVGGRFSLWSNSSLSCMIAFGTEWFRTFLEGARKIDEHVRTEPIETNMAIQLALLDYWNMTVRDIDSGIVLAYSNALRLLPAYLQQLELESNGKSVQPDGKGISAPSTKGLWGGEGTIGQHSYHQWLHQGCADVNVEFIIALDSQKDKLGTRSLTANALAQSEVLANGRTETEILAAEPDAPSELIRQKVMPGGRTSILLATKDFTPEALGGLIALYEHRTYLAGRLWGVNSFDQWGVELGKIQAEKIEKDLSGESISDDPVTRSLVNFFSS